MKNEILAADLEKVKALLVGVRGTENYKNIERLGGLTNHTYHVTFENFEEYVVRIPGEGTEEMIVRSDERKSTMLACELGIDAEVLYFGEDGTKVTAYIPNAITMSAKSLHEEKHRKQMANIFKKLHDCGRDTGVQFEVFEMASGYERIIYEKNVFMFEDYGEVKAEVMRIKNEIDNTIEIKKVPCHNDALCENWVEGNGRMYLIDWEYAGMNDGMWDLADVSIEAGFDDMYDQLFLKEYLGHLPDIHERKHFMANKIYVDYLWTLWAKARVPYSGQPMEDWALERYIRLKDNIVKFSNIEQ